MPRSEVTCPNCNHSFVPQGAKRDDHKRKLSDAAKTRWEHIRAIYSHAKIAHPGIDPLGDIGPKSYTAMLMRNLWTLTMRERRAAKQETVGFFEFNPWGRHQPSRAVFVEVFGATDRLRYEGKRLFGEDFGAEVAA